MIEHHFLTDDDIFNGYFTDENDKKRHSYHYDPDSKIMTVRCGSVSRPEDLSNRGVDRWSEDELRDHLIELAKEIGEDMIANPPLP